MAGRSTEDISINVRKLIDQCIRTVGHLETLLFLYQNSSTAYSALEISRELRTNEALAEHQLEELCPQMIGKSGERYIFTSNKENDAVLQELSDLYRERRHAIINTIYTGKSEPPDALRSFADAFKLKKD